MIFLLYHIKSTENRKTENLYEKNEIKRKAQASISIEKQEEQEIDSSGGKETFMKIRMAAFAACTMLICFCAGARGEPKVTIRNQILSKRYMAGCNSFLGSLCDNC